MQFFKMEFRTKQKILKSNIEILSLMFILCENFLKVQPKPLDDKYVNNILEKNKGQIAILRFVEDSDKNLIPNRAFIFWSDKHFMTFALSFFLIREKGQFYFRLKFADSRNLDVKIIEFLIDFLQNEYVVKVADIFVKSNQVTFFDFVKFCVENDKRDNEFLNFITDILFKIFSFDYGYIRKDKISKKDIGDSEIDHPIHHLDFSYQHKNYDLKIGLEDNFDLKCFVDLFNPYSQCFTLRSQK